MTEREHITIAPDGKPTEQQPRWRQDFPIDWGQDHYVARRDFTKFMVLTSFAFTIGQFWIAAQNFMRTRRGKLPLRAIVQLDQLAVGQALTFAYPDAHDACILVRTGEQRFAAFSQKCTHLSCAVVPQFEQRRFHCPCHNGAFDLETGQPLQGPPRRPLPRITLEIINGTLYATGLAEQHV